MDQASLNFLWAYALIDGLASGGTTQAAISPGSRSTPLVLACNAHPGITSHILIDERSAAFFALGMARLDREPVILIATSGSAPSHWFPAVIEADHSDIPLILLSADRPPELHDWEANQTTDLERLFGTHVRGFYNPGIPDQKQLETVRTLGRKSGLLTRHPLPGPVHINLPFREPLVPNPLPALPAASKPLPQPIPLSLPAASQIEHIRHLISGTPGIIIAGPGSFDNQPKRNVSTLAQRLGAPILADPLSGLRFGKHDLTPIITSYDAALTQLDECHQPAWVLRLGAPPVSKNLNRWLDKLTCPQILCTPYGRWPVPQQSKIELVITTSDLFCEALLDGDLVSTDPKWTKTFHQWEQRWQPSPYVAADESPFEGELIQTMLATMPDQSLLFSGNSMPIRQLDSWSGCGKKDIRILANRGVSGIDGNISTLLGLATASTGPVVGLIGDLTLFHDMNGLQAAKGLSGVIVLLNNNGGGIFSYLPQSDPSDFERCWLTPTNLDFKQVARLYGLEYWQVTRQSQFPSVFRQALKQPGMTLVEVVINREDSIRRQHAYWSGS
ncbi:MAG: 2-succinyl-5-enolpyruvyl-6-hydroxy-3-cyclohexene-1-carboxylic-acid synthase [Gammaproteobacteria bacterium]|nr:2-succinyl-5-enolpyruvyl-6-hydroxy-3-cyclohexene-1-carboxylic-acid synthase [Gammaproteobacteria bacterium]